MVTYNFSRDQSKGLAAAVKKLKHDAQRKTRRCHWKYVNNLVSDNTADKQTPCKEFWSYINQ